MLQRPAISWRPMLGPRIHKTPADSNCRTLSWETSKKRRMLAGRFLFGILVCRFDLARRSGTYSLSSRAKWLLAHWPLSLLKPIQTKRSWHSPQLEAMSSRSALILASRWTQPTVELSEILCPIHSIAEAQKFDGKCNLRFDDTNPESEKQVRNAASC